MPYRTDMIDKADPADAMDFLRKMWSNMGVPVPGMVVPTLDVGELEKRITDLKAVEGWLKMNLNLLQMHIQGLEMQASTLSAMKQFGPSAEAASAQNPFANPALWPWNVMQQAAAAASGNTKPEDESGKD